MTIPDFESLFEMMITQGLPLGASTKKLIQLIEVHGVHATREVVREALQKKIPRIAFIAMRLNEQDKLKNSLPAVPIVLPDRQDVREIAVVHHDLAAYDQLVNHDSDDRLSNQRGESDVND